MYGLCDRSKLSRVLVQWGWEKEEKFDIAWRVAEKQISFNSLAKLTEETGNSMSYTTTSMGRVAM